MALVPAVDLEFSDDQVTLVDETGAYNASSNPGGYGAPNAAFTDYAHHAIIRKKNVNDVDDEELTLDAYNPITDTEFSTDRSVDGWYEGKKLNITIWSAGTYPSGTVRSHAGVIYMANTSTATQPPTADWTVITDLTDIEDNATVLVTTVGRVTAYNADVYWSRQKAQLSQQGQCGECEDDRLKARLDTIYRTIQNVLVADQLGNNTSGEWNVLRLITLGAV